MVSQLTGVPVQSAGVMRHDTPLSREALSSAGAFTNDQLIQMAMAQPGAKPEHKKGSFLGSVAKLAVDTVIVAGVAVAVRKGFMKDFKPVEEISKDASFGAKFKNTFAKYTDLLFDNTVGKVTSFFSKEAKAARAAKAEAAATAKKAEQEAAASKLNQTESTEAKTAANKTETQVAEEVKTAETQAGSSTNAPEAKVAEDAGQAEANVAPKVAETVEQTEATVAPQAAKTPEENAEAVATHVSNLNQEHVKTKYNQDIAPAAPVMNENAVPFANAKGVIGDTSKSPLKPFDVKA